MTDMPRGLSNDNDMLPNSFGQLLYTVRMFTKDKPVSEAIELWNMAAGNVAGRASKIAIGSSLFAAVSGVMATSLLLGGPIAVSAAAVLGVLSVMSVGSAVVQHQYAKSVLSKVIPMQHDGGMPSLAIIDTQHIRIFDEAIRLYDAKLFPPKPAPS